MARCPWLANQRRHRSDRPSSGDPHRNPDRGQLRSIPLLIRLGINKFTFVDTWMQYQFIPFSYLKLERNGSKTKMITRFVKLFRKRLN